MACKYSRLPSALKTTGNTDTILGLKDCTILRYNTSTREEANTMYLEDHALCFVKKGTMKILKDKQTYIIGENEILLLHKAQLMDYWKLGDKTGVFQNMIIFFTDEFIEEFLKHSGIHFQKLPEPVIPCVKQINKRFHNFFVSLEDYFENPHEYDKALIKLKLHEILFELANLNKRMLMLLFQARQQAKGELVRVMEENYLKPCSIQDLAYLSGRSIASFKRDFNSIYKASPAKWIKNRRLEKANELLISTDLSVTDVCFMSGFENTAHFSKIYKSKYNLTPSDSRSLAISQ